VANNTKLFSFTFKKVPDFFCVFGAHTVRFDTTGCQLLGNTRRQSGGVSSLIPTPDYESQLLELPLFKITKATEELNRGVVTH